MTVDLCRVDFAVIPDEPMFSGVIDASQAITDEYYDNTNVIDEKTFPPHVSLHICTVPRESVAQLAESMKALAATLPELVPAGVERSDGGYVMLDIGRTDDLVALHEAVLELAAQARQGMGSDKYGSPYIRELFTPHLSLAKVDYRDQAGATRIGRETLGDLVPAPSRSLELCDIGERSEKWEVLATFARS
ncbi:MAG: 2'-5' RNA ligase family protein [Pseudonocardia sp.]